MASEVPIKVKRRGSIGFDVGFLATPLGLIRVFQIVSLWKNMNHFIDTFTFLKGKTNKAHVKWLNHC